MMIGHYALAFGAKRAAPRVSLGVLFAATALADLIWPVLVLAGAESVAITPGATAVTPLTFLSYPWSHSLAMDGLWAALLGGGYYFWRGDGRGGLVVGALVLSHWLLDLVSHAPDMPLWPGGPKLGLGLWNSLPGTLAVELGLFAMGVFFYARTAWPRTRGRRWSMTLLIAFLPAIYLPAMFGPPPPSVAAIIWTDMAQGLLIVWAWAADRRESR